jgi:glycosyltransferase involved in cell wall biosynthesis
MGIDVAVIGQDPRLRGGYRAHVQAFWRAARELGREPSLFCIGHRRATSLVRRSVALTTDAVDGGAFAGTRYPAILPELPPLNHALNAHRIGAAVASARSLWVVTTSAHHGFPATALDRRYACWVGTGFTEEADARRAGLSASQRLFLRLNAATFRRLEREVLRRAAVVYATSPSSREAVVATAELPPERVRLLPIGVEPDVFRPEADESWAERLERPVVVFVGRSPDPRKNVGLLVDAFAEIKRRLPAARLRLVGRPPLRSVLDRVPADTDVLGEVDSVAGHVRTASLFVLPSLQEGFGVAVAEALASGVPAVITPCGGPEHMVRESGGGVVLSTMAREDLVETVTQLLGDPARLLEMRRRGRDYVVRAHSPERLTRLLAEAFLELDEADASDEAAYEVGELHSALSPR